MARQAAGRHLLQERPRHLVLPDRHLPADQRGCEPAVVVVSAVTIRCAAAQTTFSSRDIRCDAAHVTSGFTTFNCSYRLKSRSADDSSATPFCRQMAAIRAS